MPDSSWLACAWGQPTPFDSQQQNPQQKRGSHKVNIRSAGRAAELLLSGGSNPAPITSDEFAGAWILSWPWKTHDWHCSYVFICMACFCSLNQSHNPFVTCPYGPRRTLQRQSKRTDTEAGELPSGVGETAHIIVVLDFAATKEPRRNTPQ